jgi:hypothetical protein
MSMPPCGHPAPGILVPTTPDSTGTPSKPQPDASNRAQLPTMQTLSARRHDELLQILQDVDALPAEALMKSDLPEQADRLLTEINISRVTQAIAKPTRRFQLFHKSDDVNRLLVKLEIESRRANIPTPYPIDKDPLGLEAWAAQRSADEVAVIAKEFPAVRNALCVYLDDSGTNHLARTFHAGANIDFELDLRAKKTWRIFPAYDAIHAGPAANFIVLMKALLFLVNRDASIPRVNQCLEDFIAVRREDEIVSLIQHCKEFSWPDTIAFVPESKTFFEAITHDHPVEHILFELIAPIVAAHPTKSNLLSLMADMNPSRLTWALKPLNFKPTDAMIANAQTAEGREALRRLKTQD